VSLGEFIEGDRWHGLPVVTELRSAFPRSRVVVGGTIVSIRGSVEGTGRSMSLGYRCVLDDGTGRIDLLFLGRDRVPGLSLGARCHVEGTARMDRGRLTMWNPLYLLEAAGCDQYRPRSVRG
jgi:hypothetical protein